MAHRAPFVSSCRRVVVLYAALVPLAASFIAACSSGNESSRIDAQTDELRRHRKEECAAADSGAPAPAPTTTTAPTSTSTSTQPAPSSDPPPPPPPSPTTFTLGDRPFVATSSWNTPIPSNATYAAMNWPASTGYNYWVNWDGYSPAIHVAQSSDPLVQVSVPDSWGYPAQTIAMRLPVGATGAAGTDGEILAVDGSTIHNCWQFERTSNTTGKCSAYGRADALTSTGWGSKSPFLGAGIVATGSSQLAGLLVQAETDKGEIEHALQIALDGALQKPGYTGDAISGDGYSSSGIAQEGERFAIAPSASMPAGLSPLGQKVFRAMKTYGVFDIDVAGGTTLLRAQANAYDAATIDALRTDVNKLIPMLKRVTF